MYIHIHTYNIYIKVKCSEGNQRNQINHSLTSNNLRSSTSSTYLNLKKNDGLTSVLERSATELMSHCSVTFSKDSPKSTQLRQLPFAFGIRPREKDNLSYNSKFPQCFYFASGPVISGSTNDPVLLRGMSDV